MDDRKVSILSEIYLDPENPAGFSSVKRLHDAAIKADPSMTVDEVKTYLSSVDSYTLHKQRRFKFTRNSYNASDIDDIWQADLGILTQYVSHNEGFNYILVAIDLFSRYVWVVPLKRKDSTSVFKGFQNIFEQASPRIPDNLQVDKGGEFKGQQVHDLMKSKGINFYTSQNPDTKAAVCERVLRSIKLRLHKYLTKFNTKRWIDVLPKITSAYNHARHRSIGMSPASVTGPDRVGKIKKKMYPPIRKIGRKPEEQLKPGDTVRISLERQTFHKGYKPGWSEEIFTIKRKVRRIPADVYQLTDSSGEIIEGTFYFEELQKVLKLDDSYLVEKVLETRMGSNGMREYLIQWKGYPLSMASWEPEKNIESLSTVNP